MIKLPEALTRIFPLPNENKNNLDVLIDEINLTYLDFSRFLKNKGISSRYEYIYSAFILEKYRKNKKDINFLLSHFPHEKTSMRASGSIQIHVNTEQMKYILRSHEIDKSLVFLDSISTYCNTKKFPDTFQFLLDKYDDTFVLLIGTLQEMREEKGEKDDENEKIIIGILQNFINEFMSLVDIYMVKRDLDKEAFHSSLKQRLTNELELTNRIKTNWNSNELLK